MTLSDKIEQILSLSNEGLSDHAISKKLKVDNHTVKISVKYIRLDKIIFTRNINVIIPKLTSL